MVQRWTVVQCCLELACCLDASYGVGHGGVPMVWGARGRCSWGCDGDGRVVGTPDRMQHVWMGQNVTCVDGVFMEWLEHRTLAVAEGDRGSELCQAAWGLVLGLGLGQSCVRQRGLGVGLGLGLCQSCVRQREGAGETEEWLQREGLQCVGLKYCAGVAVLCRGGSACAAVAEIC